MQHPRCRGPRGSARGSSSSSHRCSLGTRTPSLQLATGLGAGQGWELGSHTTLLGGHSGTSSPEGLCGESPGCREPRLSPAAAQLWQEPAALRQVPGLSLSFNTVGRKRRAKAMSCLGKNHARRKLPCPPRLNPGATLVLKNPVFVQTPSTVPPCQPGFEHKQI